MDVRRGSIASSLAAVVRERGAGLLVVSRGGTAHRVGTIAYRVMREADVPTLVVARPVRSSARRRRGRSFSSAERRL